MKIKLLVAILMFALLLFKGNSAATAEVKVYKNESSGLLTWNLEGEGFEIELIQLLPDFVRAIYAKHNFPKNELERIAAFCVFGTILKNTSEKNMSYQVSDWRYQNADNKALPVKTKTQWLEEWRKAGILFSWTLLPDTGDFSVGDWQQGFTLSYHPNYHQRNPDQRPAPFLALQAQNLGSIQ